MLILSYFQTLPYQDEFVYSIILLHAHDANEAAHQVTVLKRYALCCESEPSYGRQGLSGASDEVQQVLLA